MKKRPRGPPPRAEENPTRKLPGRSDENFVLPVVIGTIARKTNQMTTATPPVPIYDWIVYLRALDEKPLSPWISKVEFILHSSITNRKREVTSEPFETNASGWGMFNVPIKVHMREDVFGEKLVTELDQLRLKFEPDVQGKHKLPTDEGNGEEFCRAAPPLGDPVVCERVDEIVIAPLTEAAGAIDEALRKRKAVVAPQQQPKGTKALPAWELIQKHRPHYQTDERLQVNRFLRMIDGVNTANETLSTKMRDIMWEQAAALQRLAHVQSLVDTSRAAKKRRIAAAKSEKQEEGKDAAKPK